MSEWWWERIQGVAFQTMACLRADKEATKDGHLSSLVSSAGSGVVVVANGNTTTAEQPSIVQVKHPLSVISKRISRGHLRDTQRPG